MKLKTKGIKFLTKMLIIISTGITMSPTSSAEKSEVEGTTNEVCAEFAKDIDADMGKILKAGCEPTLAQMSKLMDNPLGNVAMLFTQFDLYRLENDTFNKERNLGVYTGIFQFPKKLNDDWNLINRIIWTVPSVPVDNNEVKRFKDADWNPGPGGIGSLPPGTAPVDLIGGRTTGFGDMYYVGLFSPSEGIDVDWGEGKILWGAGFDVAAPTAEYDVLGSEKWSAGPAVLGIYMGPKWKIGALGMHYWDFAGDDDAADVNTTNLQYFIYYSLDETSAIGAGPNIIADWEQDKANRYSVPIGLGYNTTLKFGKVPVRLGFEVYKYIVQPDDIPTPDWGFRFFIIPAAPSALFDWMQ